MRKLLLGLFLFITASTHAAWTTIPGTITGAPDLATTATLNNYVPVTRTVAGHALTTNITVSKSDVGLSNADNTSDANKPVSTATQTALNLKATSGQIINIDVSANAAIVSTKLAGVATGGVGIVSGQLGEYITSGLVTGVSFGSIGAVAFRHASVASINITSGDWDVSGMVGHTVNSGTMVDVGAGVSTTGGTGSGSGGTTLGISAVSIINAPSATNDVVLSCPVVRFSVAGTTTLYLKALAKGVSGTSSEVVYGNISARRVR